MVQKFGIIRQTVFLEASPQEVYEAFLDPLKHSAFTGSPSTSTFELGVEFTAWDGYITAKNVELVKNERIVQEWETSEWPEGYPASRLELSLGSRRGGTELTMVHSKVPAEQVEEYRGGWVSSYWDPLKGYLARERKAQRKTKLSKRVEKRATVRRSRSSP